MAYFQYPLRKATDPENWAFAYPERERGVMRPRLDNIGLDLGTRLQAKVPFYVGGYLVGLYEEFAITEKNKTTNGYVITAIKNENIKLEVNGDEIDANFYTAPGPELSVKSQPVYALLGEPEKPKKD
jgi:hypothetical protein